jgi:regulator of protease activity HflC (stomatin/prohibitin superfamily)
MSSAILIVLAVVVLTALITLPLALHIVAQYEIGVQFRFGRVIGTKNPGLAVIIPDHHYAYPIPGHHHER